MLPLLVMRALFALSFAALVVFHAEGARAQCGAATSSCRTCHEVRGAGPVQNDGTLWHRDHAFADLCSACHGGDASTSVEASAHSGMVAPLGGDAAACTSCHGRSAAGFVTKYRAAPRAPAPASSASGTASPAFGPTATPPRGPHWRDTGLALGALALGAFGAAYVFRNERRRSSLRTG